MRKLLLVVLVIAAFAVPTFAQDMTPSVTVVDQLVTDHVVIDSAVSAGPGFVVIHIDNDGAPGPVAGFAPVVDGENTAIEIDIDTTIATPVLYAMLHTDDGTVGMYEFDGASGLDNPVAVDGAVVTPAFNVAIIDAADQFVADDNTVTIGSIVTPVDGWIVIHEGSSGSPGPVLGQTLVSAGANADVVVELTEGAATSTLFPMLHVDDGEIGTYEFDGASGLDNPVSVGGAVAVVPFSTVPSIRAREQAIVSLNGAPLSDAPTFSADYVLSSGDGWLVIHADNGGSPGPVLGQTQVTDGTNADVVVELATEGLTPVVFPMLHVDDGAVGTYEFDGASGLDNPVAVEGKVVTFPVAISGDSLMLAPMATPES